MTVGALARLARTSLVLSSAVALLWSCIGSAGGETGSLPTPSIRIPAAPPTGRRRPITLADILSVRYISEPTLSPDASKVAYLVSQAFLSCNCTQTALYVGSASDARRVRKIDQESNISALRWTPDGRHLSFLSARGGAVQLWWIDPMGGAPERVFAHTASAEASLYPNPIAGPVLPAGVIGYEWSPDGRQLAFTAVRPVDPEARRRAELEGFRYDDARMTEWDLTAGGWLRAGRTPQLWTYDMQTRRAHLLWQSPAGSTAAITHFEWAPDGGHLAVSYEPGAATLHAGTAVLDARTGRVKALADIDGSVEAMTWSQDGSSVALLVGLIDSNEVRLRVVRADSTASRYVARHLFGAARYLLWMGDRFYLDASGIGLRHENGGLYELGAAGRQPMRITSLEAKIADCSDPVGFRVACVWQTPNDPPRVVVVDLQSGKAQRLADVNPELEAVRRGPVEEFHWSNRFGDTTNGYLVLPPGPQRDRLPLVVMGYGFDGGFVAQANRWLTSYPAQAFARDGFAVLLINHPYWPYWDSDYFRHGAHANGYGPLASLEAIIDRLSADGLVDRKRVGFMGHSWSGFWVQFTASHSDLLRAAELHNGGTGVEPGFYSGNGAVRALQDHIMGGGPYPPTLRNYVGFSAMLTTDRVRVPILMENDAEEAQPEMDYFTALKVHHVPVEWIIYPNDGHVFVMPSHRIASMQRNLDWFEYWLLGKSRADPGAAAQYAEWGKLRIELQALRTSGRR